MKKMKKILAFVMAMAMVLGMSVTAFAEGESTKPKATDTASITVKNVEAGATVKAYQIVKAKYGTSGEGFLGYESVKVVENGVEKSLVADPKQPTSLEAGEIAANVSSYNLTPVDLQPKGDNEEEKAAATEYSADVNAGYWLVLVEKTDSKEIYNPMLLGVYYTKSGSENDMANGELDLSTQNQWNLTGDTAYSKKTKPTITKNIVVENGQTEETKKGDDVAIGDSIKYRIESDIPTYSEQYTSVTYKITDTIDAGLTFGTLQSGEGGPSYVKNVTVKCGEDNLLQKNVGETTETRVAVVSYNDANGGDGRTMTIAIDSTYILANGGKKIVVEYTATLNENASVNLKPNTNKATLSYSNKPDINAQPVEETAKTYHYTFALDSGLYGDEYTGENSWNKITEELVKVNNGTAEKITTTINGKTYEITTTRLVGAEFTLTSKTDSTKVYQATSDIYGHLAFSGLDTGNYTLKEIKAPEGYTLIENTIDVSISANYNTDSEGKQTTLNYYTVTVGQNSNTYKALYGDTSEPDKVTGVKLITINGEGKEEDASVPDTAKIALPSKVEEVEGETTKDVTSEMIKLSEYTIISNPHGFVNTKLSELPSTGGIGTTIFTIGGCAIMIIAAGLFFASRRKSSK